MEILLIAFIAGIIGSLFMDITELLMSKVGISSGVKGAYIGAGGGLGGAAELLPPPPQAARHRPAIRVRIRMAAF